MQALERLRAWREATARQERLSRPFLVVPDSTIMAIASRTPKTLEQLSRIEGVTTRHVEKYGQDILKALAEGHWGPGGDPLFSAPSGDSPG